MLIVVPATIAAIIIGIIALVEIKKSKGLLVGSGLAWAGIIIGLLGFVVIFLVAVPSYFEAQPRAKVAMIRSEMQMLATGLEFYYVDYSSYPLSLNELTTPIPYLTQLPKDVFADHDNYDYETDLLNCWMVRSNGPDYDKDVDLELALKKLKQDKAAQPEGIYDPTNGTKSSGDIVRWGPR